MQHYRKYGVWLNGLTRGGDGDDFDIIVLGVPLTGVAFASAAALRVAPVASAALCAASAGLSSGAGAIAAVGVAPTVASCVAGATLASGLRRARHHGDGVQRLLQRFTAAAAASVTSAGPAGDPKQ